MRLEATTPSQLAELAGQTAGPSSWIRVSAQRIQAFADATGDHQWIHLDAQRTQAQLGHPPVAHGYLTLSLLPTAMYEMVQIADVGQIINYGVNKIRFISPVFAGDRLRASATLARASREEGFTRTVFDVVVNVERLEKPVMAAQLIILYFDSRENEDG